MFYSSEISLPALTNPILDLWNLSWDNDGLPPNRVPYEFYVYWPRYRGTKGPYYWPKHVVCFCWISFYEWICLRPILGNDVVNDEAASDHPKHFFKVLQVTRLVNHSPWSLKNSEAFLNIFPFCVLEVRKEFTRWIRLVAGQRISTRTCRSGYIPLGR